MTGFCFVCIRRGRGCWREKDGMLREFSPVFRLFCILQKWSYIHFKETSFLTTNMHYSLWQKNISCRVIKEYLWLWTALEWNIALLVINLCKCFKNILVHYNIFIGIHIFTQKLTNIPVCVNKYIHSSMQNGCFRWIFVSSFGLLHTHMHTYKKKTVLGFFLQIIGH